MDNERCNFWHRGHRIQRTLDDQVRAEDTHAANTNTSLGSAIGGAKAGEDDGGRAAQRTKEGLEKRYVSHIIETSLN